MWELNSLSRRLKRCVYRKCDPWKHCQSRSVDDPERRRVDGMLSGVSERLEQHQDHFGQRRGCFIARRKCWSFHNDDKLLIDVKRQCVGCFMMTVLKSQFSMHRLGSIMYFGKKIPTVQFSTTSVRSPFCIRSIIHFESDASNQYTLACDK